MQLKPLNFSFLTKPDVQYYGTDCYGNSIYLYHAIAFVELNGELIPYIYIDEE